MHWTQRRCAPSWMTAHALKAAWKRGDREPILKHKSVGDHFRESRRRAPACHSIWVCVSWAARQSTCRRPTCSWAVARRSADTAGVLSRYVDAIMIRTVSHQRMLDLADAGTVPVINGLTDRTHPCQLMADIQTVEEHRGPIAGKTIAWAGDGNNMACSWIHAAVQVSTSGSTSRVRNAIARTARCSGMGGTASGRRAYRRHRRGGRDIR